MGLNPGQVVYHASYGTGRVLNVEDNKTAVNFIRGGIKYFTNEEADEVLSETPFEDEKDDEAEGMDDLKYAVREVLREEGVIGITTIADRWDGGEVIIKPGKPGLKEKVIPIDVFFHKIVMIRDRLRVLEQNINSSDKLSDREKVDIQQYITRCYGSLTTFNVLFADRDDWFTGDKKE